MILTDFGKHLEDNTIYKPEQIEEVIKKVRTNFRFHRSNTKHKYFNVPAALDLETSSFYNKDGEKVGLTYVWVFGIYGLVIIGRTWNELSNMFDNLSSILDLNINKRLLVYIHNASFDFQFLRHHFTFEKVFASDHRVPLYALTTSGIEFRCSYQLSGMSLEKTGENLLTYKVSKKTGDLDYSLIRHEKTPLTKTELGYIVNDAKVVMAFIAEEIERNNGIGRLPLTKTGYVRKHCRNKIFIDPETGKKDKKKGRKFHEVISICTLTPEIYDKTRDAFAGGFCHGNAIYINKTVENVSSYDFTSSYPSVMLDKFPMGSPVVVDTTQMSGDEFYDYISLYNCIFTIHFYGLKQNPEVFENYISRSKCKYASGDCKVNNGRIVQAAEIMITITEVDFQIIKEFYTYDYFEISYLVYWHKAYLPKDFILSILELYKAKTVLKGVESKEVEYMVSKGMLNATYGMSVCKVVRPVYEYTDDWEPEKAANKEEEIEKYNKQRGRFLYYPWGVYVTAYARQNLFTAIKEAGIDYVYSDTDSIKLKNAAKHKKYFEDYNKKVIAKLTETCEFYNIDLDYIRPKTIKGEEKPLGVWDYEGTYSRFKTLGAKRYMIEKKGVLDLTVSGVNKKLAVPYLLESCYSPYNKYGTNTAVFNSFKDGLVIPPGYSGKSTHTYIDEPREGYVTDYRGIDCYYKELSGIHLEETSYNLGMAGEFISYLKLLTKGI